MPEAPKKVSLDEVVKEILDQILSKKINVKTTELLNLIWVEINELRGSGVMGMPYEKYPANDLTKFQGKLALYKADLGDAMAELGRNYEFAKNYADLKKGNIRNQVAAMLTQKYKKKPLAGDISAEVSRQCFNEKTAVLFWEEKYAKCLNLWRSLNSLLDAIQTRCHVLSSGLADAPSFEDAAEFDLPDMDFSREEKEMVDTDVKTHSSEDADDDDDIYV